MLDLANIAEIFDDYKSKIGRLKKSQYEENMKHFRKKYGHYFDAMLEEVDRAGDKEAVARAIGEQLAEAVFETMSTNSRFFGRKIKGTVQTDLNIFMIYYVFPAILLTDHMQAVCLCDNIRDSWKANFKGSDIQYADYRTMYDNFQEKLLGIM